MPAPGEFLPCQETRTQRLRAQAKIVSGQIAGRLPGHATDLACLQRRLDDSGNVGRDLILKLEHVFERTVEPVGPQMRAGLRLDQLRRDAHPVARFAHAAFEHVAHSQFAGDLPHVDGSAFVGGARVAGDNEQPADARERGDDLLDHAVGEIFLLRIAAQILKRQYRNRGFVRQWHRRRYRRFYAKPHAPDMHRPCNVLDLLLARVLEGEIELVAYLAVDYLADADAARLGERFQTCRDVDTVAKDVAPIANDVAEIDADAELDPLFLRDLSIALGHPLLHFDSATHRIDNAGELNKQAIAGGFDDAPAMLLDLGIPQLAADRLQRCERTFLVRSHQSRIARDIGGQDRGKTACLGHFPSPAARRRPSSSRLRCSGMRRKLQSEN